MNAKGIAIGALLLILGLGGGYFFATSYKVVPAAPEPVATPTATVETIISTAPVASPVVSPVVQDDKAAVIAMVKASEVARMGADANSSTYTVTQLQGNYARGTAGGTGGGAIWLAAKVGGVWKMVFIGNGTVQCSDLTNYPDLPKAMMSECWDAVNQKNVTR